MKETCNIYSSLIPGGYVLLARYIQSNKISFQNPCTREVWYWLILNANYSDASYKGHVIKRGQLFRSYADIRDGLSWHVGWRKERYTENQIKKAMKNLRDASMIITKKLPGGVLITLCNYGFYQSHKNYEGTTNDTIENTNIEPNKNHPIAYNNKKENNNNNEENFLYKEFLEIFNSITGRNFGNDNVSRNQFNKLISKYSMVDMEKAIRNGFEASKSWKNPGYFTPNYFLRREKFEMFLEDSWNKPENNSCELLSVEQVRIILKQFFGKTTEYFIKTLQRTTVEDFLWHKIVKSKAAAEYLLNKLHKNTGGDIKTAIALLNKTLKGN